jgi:hypothetical protein
MTGDNNEQPDCRCKKQPGGPLVVAIYSKQAAFTAGRGSMQPFNPDGRDAAFALLQGEAHALTLVQFAQASMLHGADMDKDIISAFIRRDEAIAFSGIEPFYNTGQHSHIRPHIVVLHRFHLRTLFLTWQYQAGGLFFTGRFLPAHEV